MNFLIEYIYYIFGLNDIEIPIKKNNKRKYDDCIDTSNIILEKRIRKSPCRYSF